MGGVIGGTEKKRQRGFKKRFVELRVRGGVNEWHLGAWKDCGDDLRGRRRKCS